MSKVRIHVSSQVLFQRFSWRATSWICFLSPHSKTSLTMSVTNFVLSFKTSAGNGLDVCFVPQAFFLHAPQTLPAWAVLDLGADSRAIYPTGTPSLHLSVRVAGARQHCHDNNLQLGLPHSQLFSCNCVCKYKYAQRRGKCVQLFYCIIYNAHHASTITENSPRKPQIIQILWSSKWGHNSKYALGLWLNMLEWEIIVSFHLESVSFMLCLN